MFYSEQHIQTQYHLPSKPKYTEIEYILKNHINEINRKQVLNYRFQCSVGTKKKFIRIQFVDEI